MTSWNWTSQEIMKQTDVETSEPAYLGESENDCDTGPFETKLKQSAPFTNYGKCVLLNFCLKNSTLLCMYGRHPFCCGCGCTGTLEVNSSWKKYEPFSFMFMQNIETALTLLLLRVATLQRLFSLNSSYIHMHTHLKHLVLSMSY